MPTHDDIFFAQYDKKTKTDEGIPGITMNAPLVQNTLQGAIGLELELEARNALPREGHLETVRAPTTGAMWEAVADGSLRGESREYIFSQPVLPDELPVMLNGLWEAFKSYGSRISNSNRCSTHVHINMRGKTVNTITSIISLWSTLEESAIRWCGEERVRNHFALSTQDAPSLIMAWESFLRYGQVPTDRGLKYSALNILPLFSKGSLEFRCGPASNDPATPATWALFLYHLVEFASSAYQNPFQLAQDLSERGGYAILCDITKNNPLLREEMLAGTSIEEFDRSAMRGFRTVQPLALGFPWDRWLTLINKEYVPNPFAGRKPKFSIRRQPVRDEALDIEWREIPPQRPAAFVDDIAEGLRRARDDMRRARMEPPMIQRDDQ